MSKIIVIKRGSAVVKIYTGKCRGSPLHTISFYQAGQRKRLTFANLAEAKKEARSIASKIDTGQQQALKLTDKDRHVYTTAREVLAPTGKRLEIAATEYAEAFKMLKTGNLIEAVRFYNKHHNTDIPQKKIPEIFKELKEAKKADKVSKVYLSDLQYRLGHFSECFPGLIADVTTAELEDWLRKLKLSPRSRNNYRNILITFFRFAQRRGYLLKGQETEAESVQRVKEMGQEPGILSPDEMTALLNHAPADIVPFIVIGGFAGLRHSELLRLQWEDIDFEAPHIYVRAQKSKTRQRRIVQITNNLSEWLALYRKEKGPICPYKRMDDKIGPLASKLDPPIKWPHNALRHSFGSYLLALLGDDAKVAMEMGNSPRMLFQHYRDVVSKKQAQKWFAILPEQTKLQQDQQAKEEAEMMSNCREAVKIDGQWIPVTDEGESRTNEVH
jgi:integrase